MLQELTRKSDRFISLLRLANLKARQRPHEDCAGLFQRHTIDGDNLRWATVLAFDGLPSLASYLMHCQRLA